MSDTINIEGESDKGRERLYKTIMRDVWEMIGRGMMDSPLPDEMYNKTLGVIVDTLEYYMTPKGRNMSRSVLSEMVVFKTTKAKVKK